MQIQYSTLREKVAMTETDIKAPEKEKLRLQSKGKKKNDMETSAETETVSDTKNSYCR